MLLKSRSFLTTLLLLIIIFLTVPKSVFAYTAQDFADSSKYNFRIDGPVANNFIDSVQIGDIDGNGLNDIVIGSSQQDYNSRSNSGSVFIILDSIISSLATNTKTIDLSDSSKYSMRFDGAVAGDFFGYSILLTDLDNNGQTDLLIGAAFASMNSRSQSGSLYVIKDTILKNYQGTGNNIDTNVSSNYNLRFDGAQESTQLAYSSFTTGDLNSDNKTDLLVGAPYTLRHGDEFVGGVYLILDSLIDDYSGTGNNIDLLTSSNYNVLFKRGSADDGISYENGVKIADVSGDGINDIIFAASFADFNSRTNSGSIYFIYSSLLPQNETTGNLMDLAVSTNYNVRFDGATAGEQLGYGALSIADVDGNGHKDLAVGAPFSSLNCSYCGSVYYINDSLFINIDGTGNNIDLNTSSKFTTRIDGVTANNYFGWGVFLTDYDHDSKIDLFASNPFTDLNSRADSGSLYGIRNNSLTQNVASTGNVLLISTDTVGIWRYDGASADDKLAFAQRALFTDLNGDGSNDLLAISKNADNNSRTDSGSLYIVYNFPHTFTVNFGSDRVDTSFSFTGQISASNSVTTIAGVQYQIDGNSPSGDWINCSPTDGSFDSLQESFSCNVSGLAKRDYVLYLRSYDSLSKYTSQGSYDLHRITTLNNSSPSLEKEVDRFICTAAAPIGEISLFQLDMTNTSATLFYTPVQQNISGYAIIYGLGEGDERFGVEYNQSNNSGVQSFRINNLSPNTKYSFKIVPRNGCNAGKWSKWLTGKTTGEANLIKQFYLFN